MVVVSVIKPRRMSTKWVGNLSLARNTVYSLRLLSHKQQQQASHSVRRKGREREERKTHLSPRVMARPIRHFLNKSIWVTCRLNMYEPFSRPKSVNPHGKNMRKGTRQNSSKKALQMHPVHPRSTQMTRELGKGWLWPLSTGLWSFKVNQDSGRSSKHYS